MLRPDSMVFEMEQSHQNIDEGLIMLEGVTRQTEAIRVASLSEVTEPKIDQGGPVGMDDFVYIDISSVDNKLKRITEPKRLAVTAAPSRAKQRLKVGDVLVSMTRPNLNAVAIVPQELDGAIGSTGFHVLRAIDCTEPRWLYYAVQAHHFISAMSELVQGALYPAVRPKDIRIFEIPIPPLDQQKRIIAEIEKQFSRLDEAVANLKRVKANLKRYKAAVLKAAVEGRLVETEAELARRDGRSYETGEQLLQRILETRRSQWKGKGKYKEAAEPDTSDLPELPEGWVWASVSHISEKVVDGTHHTPAYVPEGIPFISVKDVRDSNIHFEDTKFISLSVHEELIKRCNPEKHDVLITKSGTIGRTAVITTDRPFSLFVSVALIKPVKPSVNSGFLQIALDAYIQSIDISQDVKGGLLKNLHLEDLRVVAIPMPPKSEQNRIVAEADRRLSILRETESQIDTNFKRAERLRQAILKKMFSGE